VSQVGHLAVAAAIVVVALLASLLAAVAGFGGAVVLLAVLYRHTRFGRDVRLDLRDFAWLGAAAGFFSALVGTVGPLVAPFFLTYGLSGGAYIGTEALTALTMHAVKLTVYGGAAVLTPRVPR
jgi:uncharacterized protein